MTWPPAHPEARREFRHAVAYFRNEVSRSLARRFVLRTMSAVRRASEFPGGGSPIGRQTRRVQILPFSYDLIYLPDFDGDIFIVAVAHHRQRPHYWRDRI